jgi:prolipoprotein diacylglyceryltransferase
VTIAFHLPGGSPVYLFTLLIGGAASLGLGLTLTRTAPAHAARAFLAGLAALLGALLGGRAAYLGVNWAYYRAHTAEILQFPLGGLAWGGALAGGALVVWLAARLLAIPLKELAAALFPLLPLLALAAWLGCWLDGCAYGAVSPAWYAMPARDEWGNVDQRVPIQLIGAVWSLLTLAGFNWVQRAVQTPELAAALGAPVPPALPVALGLADLALQLWALTSFRVDPAPQWLGYRLDLWAAWAFAALAALTLVLAFRDKVGNTPASP